jgi:alginate O-acetyltransferase complex protein AlgI
MSLNSPLFLFLFLPLALLLHLAVGRKIRNSFLLIASLVFLVFCDPIYFPLLIGLALLNYFLGLWLEKKRNDNRKTGSLLAFILAINISILLGFKIVAAYFPQFGPPLLTSIPGFPFTIGQISLAAKYIVVPIGLSIFTFQVLSYQMDLYKHSIKAERNLLHFGLYLLMFPRLIAGPIMRFSPVDAQLHDRSIPLKGLTEGSRRFIRGLAKKTLIADQLASIDPGIFGLTSGLISTPLAWLSLISFSLRIYFDFSGYTDMALGIGQMLGFRFAENFNYPYISTSLSEFWRRWHMTLSGWFREYVFYPLERHRHGQSGIIQSVNIMVVFLLTGLWHGVTVNFLLWGLFQGIVISIETAGWGKVLKKQHPTLQHFYALLVILISWLIFVSPSPTFTLQYLRSLIGLQGAPQFIPFYNLAPIQPQTWLALVLGMILSVPIIPMIQKTFKKRWLRHSMLFSIIGDFGLLLLLVLSMLVISNATFHPYIYGRF